MLHLMAINCPGLISNTPLQMPVFTQIPTENENELFSFLQNADSLLMVLLIVEYANSVFKKLFCVMEVDINIKPRECLAEGSDNFIPFQRMDRTLCRLLSSHVWLSSLLLGYFVILLECA